MFGKKEVRTKAAEAEKARMKAAEKKRATEMEKKWAERALTMFEIENKTDIEQHVFLHFGGSDNLGPFSDRVSLDIKPNSTKEFKVRDLPLSLINCRSFGLERIQTMFVLNDETQFFSENANSDTTKFDLKLDGIEKHDIDPQKLEQEEQQEEKDDSSRSHYRSF